MGTQDKFECYKCDNKPHLDLRYVSSREEDNNITFKLELYGIIKDRNNTNYEIQGWFNDQPQMYLAYNFIIRYSNKVTTLSYDNETVLTVTNNTEVGLHNLTVTLSKELFPNPTKFNFIGQCSEYDPSNGRNYLDSTDPIETIAKNPPIWDTETFLLILGVISLVFILVILRLGRIIPLKISSKNVCSKCGGSIGKNQDFCYSCGELQNRN